MLLSLHVKNLALIEETEVFFGRGLNILTGETGAGKSVLLGSVNLALGAKTDRDVIRTGAEYGLVELIFSPCQSAREWMRAQGFADLEEETVLIQRRIQPGRSVCRVNGETVSNRQLRDLASILIAIHGQNESQTLLNKRNQLEILDAFGGEEIDDLKKQVAAEYAEYMARKEGAAALDMDERERMRELSLASFEANEIDKAALREGEDEELEAAFRKMSHSQSIAQALGEAVLLCSGESGALSDALGRAERELASIASYDDKLNDFYGQLCQIESLLGDFDREAGTYLEDLEIDGEEFRRVGERLDLINRLKEKYGRTIGEILAYGKKCQERVAQLSDLERRKEESRGRLAKQEEKLEILCGKLCEARKEMARQFSDRLVEALSDLNFQTVSFQVVFRQKEEYSPNGRDEAEFYISVNPGEPMKPLASVASGGELSRIMLAVKSVCADADEIETLLFDEIDAGIGGQTAWRVSKKLAKLAKTRQVIAITHLPQIAAMADSHFLIEKVADEHSAKTSISELDEQQTLLELARMLGGEDETGAAMANARELKRLAKDWRHRV